MTWDQILFLSLMGFASSATLVSLAAVMGIRYRRELPKLPIVRSLEALEEQRRNLEEELADLHDQFREARSTITEGNEWKAWLEEKAEEIERTRRELSKLSEEREKLEQVRAELESLEGRVKAEKERVEGLRDDAHKNGLERDRLAAEAADLQRRREELQAALETLSDEHAVLKSELPGLRASVEHLEAERDTLEENLVPLREEMEKTRADVARLGEEKAGLEGSISRLEEERDRLLRLLEQLQESHRAAGGAAEGQDPLEELYLPWIALARKSGGTTDERARLKALSQELGRAGVRFPERTLHAFHTALKVQDLAPLTVLAGLSGTGKSLLPALYARGMGLHFLNLPVQPSWNSPQDLFGFYNYLEHKYKATPLARAALQFARYGRPEEISPALDDQMLLVLLDEMNLARIEYYFSELLSRLELRRTMDPGNEEARKAVSIPLEIPTSALAAEDGAIDLAEGALSIYPSENILFTGTMNEDESTLSLSDKVLDRATVLRFGRPSEVEVRPPNVNDLAAAPPLAFEVWQKWTETGDQELSEDFQHLVYEELGEVLAELGTPLTHRAAQGIYRYLLLHPEGGTRGRQHALADQIEQKVLPRVRGREIGTIEEPMRRLADLLEKRLDDGALAGAIRTALRDEQGVFLWTGLDRSED